MENQEKEPTANKDANSKPKNHKRHKEFFPRAIIRRIIKLNSPKLSSKDAEIELGRFIESKAEKIIQMALELSKDTRRKTLMGKDIKKAIKLQEMR